MEGAGPFSRKPREETRVLCSTSVNSVRRGGCSSVTLAAAAALLAVLAHLFGAGLHVSLQLLQLLLLLGGQNLYDLAVDPCLGDRHVGIDRSKIR